MSKTAEKNLSILHINSNYIYTSLHKKMIECLNKHNIMNKIYVPTYNKGLSVVECDDNVCVSECFKKNDRFLFYFKQSKIFKDIECKYNFKDFNCVHAYTLFTDGNVAYNLKKKYGLPYVVAVRNTDINNFFKYMIHLRKKGIKIMKNASAICFLSESYKNLVFNKYIPKKLVNELEKKTYIIANGIDDFWLENRFTERKSIDNSNIIKVVYAGRIDANKNIECTQKALELLRNKGYSTKFTIVGKIADKKVFDNIMKYSDTEYLGSMTKEELIKVYRNSDIFVMPSHSETFGLVYAEAMSQGLPILYTKGQGFDGQFEEGLVGFHVNDSNFEDVANGILKILSNYEKIYLNSLVNCLKFNWHEIILKYFDIYLDITN